MAKTEYTGELATPMPPYPTAGELLNYELNEKLVQEWVAQGRDKLRLLCNFHDIDWNDGTPDWELLAITLACAHVPGFRIASATQPKGSAGRPSTLRHPEHIAACQELLDSVQSMRAGNSRLGELECLKRLKRNPEKLPQYFRSRVVSGALKLETLRAYLRSAKEERERARRQTVEFGSLLGQGLLGVLPLNGVGGK